MNINVKKAIAEVHASIVSTLDREFTSENARRDEIIAKAGVLIFLKSLQNHTSELEKAPLLQNRRGVSKRIRIGRADEDTPFVN